MPLETLLLLTGFAAGFLAAVLAMRRHQALGAATAWGLFVASLFWIARYSHLSNQADEMAGIGPALVAGLLFWFVTVPSALVLVLGWRRRRVRPGSQDPSPGD